VDHHQSDAESTAANVRDRDEFVRSITMISARGPVNTSPLQRVACRMP